LLTDQEIGISERSMPGSASSKTGNSHRASGLAINLGQIQTFFKLVEEGSVARASLRLALSHSTISAHIKATSDELGQKLFSRLHGGLVVTPAGLETYNKLKPLVTCAGFCIGYFHAGLFASPAPLKVAMSSGFPGSLLDIAVSRSGRKLFIQNPQQWILPAYAHDDVSHSNALVLRNGGQGGAHGFIQVSDRWVIVRSNAAAGWRSEPVRIDDLAGVTITVPKLPNAQLGMASALAERARTSLTWTSLDIHELFVDAAQRSEFCALIPASLLNPALVLQHFECAPLEQSDLDPAILIEPTGFEAIKDVIVSDFQSLLAEMLRGNPIDASVPEPECLSLKLSHSFIALYEEGNVRRAAERVCIVQPALTVQLHRLEELLNTQLFRRSSRGLHPNKNAERLYTLLAALMTDFVEAVSSLRAPVDGRPRRLRLGLIPALDAESETAECFARALASWSNEHPDHVVQALEAYSSTLVRWLRAGKIDFALVDRLIQDPDIACEPIAEDTMAVVSDSRLNLLPPGPVTLKDAARLPLVLPSSRHGLRSLLLSQLREQGLDLQPRVEVDSMSTALSLVKIAPYATILPVGAIYKSFDRRRLAVHEICEPKIKRSICLAQVKNEHVTEAGQYFVDELRAAFEGARRAHTESSVLSFSEWVLSRAS
jgi:DNA-binding transcriptional LysR family regulator